MKENLLCNAPNQIFNALKSYGFCLVFMIFAFNFTFSQNDHANENATVEGGTIITTDNTSICLGDDNPDTINVTVEGASGRVKHWIVTDDNNDDPKILVLPETSEIDFSEFVPGDYRIYHISYNGLKPLFEPFWHKHVMNFSDLLGKFDLSDNFIAVIVQQKPTGGTLEGGPFEFCVGDSEPDYIQEGAITLSGNMGANMQWVITNEDGSTITALPLSYTDINFDEEPAGTSLIWHLMYEDGITGLEVGAATADIMGCFEFSSNSITVIKRHTEGGTLEGGPFEFCVGDDEADNIPDGAITLSGNEGTNSQWVVTNEDGSTILALPDNYSDVNFDEAPAGTCLVWHLSYEDGLTGLEVNAPTADLMGCFNLSNSITVIRKHTEGGTIDGGPFEFTVGDDTADKITEGAITLTGNEGTNSQWVITNQESTTILALASNYTELNFDGTGAGTSLIWHLSYEDGLEGLVVDGLVADLMGCYSLSNSLNIVKTIASAGIVWVFPNPAGGTVNVDLSNLSSKDFSISVYNLLNSRVFESDYNSNIFTNGKIISLNISDYQDGLYFIKVIDNSTGKDYTKRLIVK